MFPVTGLKTQLSPAQSAHSEAPQPFPSATTKLSHFFLSMVQHAKLWNLPKQPQSAAETAKQKHWQADACLLPTWGFYSTPLPCLSLSPVPKMRALLQGGKPQYIWAASNSTSGEKANTDNSLAGLAVMVHTEHCFQNDRAFKGYQAHISPPLH